MLHDILTFISQNDFKEREAQRKHELAVLAEKRQIAEATGDAIKLLLVDRDLGADFDRRLHEALALQAKTPQNGGVRIAPEGAEEEGQPADPVEGNDQRRKARR